MTSGSLPSASAPPGAPPPGLAIDGVFSGGGVKGIALAGAAAAAMEAGYRFTQVVGTSSGALVGALVAAGYGPDDLRDAVIEIDWPSLADPVAGARIPLLGRHIAMVTSQAMYRGVRLERTWRALLRARGVRHFGDLPDGALRVVTTDITHQRGVVLPDDLPDYGFRPGLFPVAKAVHMSAAAPFFFRPVPLQHLRRQDAALFVDGAVAANFPLRLADWGGERPVVGFRIGPGSSHHIHRDVRGPISLATALITSAIGAQATLNSPLLQRAAVVEIPVDRDPLDFAITAADARALFLSGVEAAERFLHGLPGRRLAAEHRRLAAAG